MHHNREPVKQVYSKTMKPPSEISNHKRQLEQSHGSPFSNSEKTSQSYSFFSPPLFFNKTNESDAFSRTVVFSSVPITLSVPEKIDERDDQCVVSRFSLSRRVKKKRKPNLGL